jgi:DNA-binding CsgD family transcriptional regulator
VNPEIEAVRELEDPLKQAQQASELLTRYQTAVTQLSHVRREAIEQLIAQGMTKAQLADSLGMTRARVGQLLAAGPLNRPGVGGGSDPWRGWGHASPTEVSR